MRNPGIKIAELERDLAQLRIANSQLAFQLASRDLNDAQQRLVELNKKEDEAIDATEKK